MDDEKIVEEIKRKLETGDWKRVSAEERARSLGLKTPEEAKEYLDNLFTEYQFQCYGEKRPDGCYRLANYHENVSGKFDEAARIHKKTCDDYKYPRCCYHYANASMFGRGCKKDLVESYNYNIKACNLNVGRSCLNAGAMAFGAVEVPQNTEFGIKCLEKACDLKVSVACIELFNIYMNSLKGVTRDAPRALECALKACAEDNIAGCVNASVMYKRGDGIPKDEVLASVYRKKAVDLQEAILRPPPQAEFGEGHTNL